MTIFMIKIMNHVDWVEYFSRISHDFYCHEWLLINSWCHKLKDVWLVCSLFEKFMPERTVLLLFSYLISFTTINIVNRTCRDVIKYINYVCFLLNVLAHLNRIFKLFWSLVVRRPPGCLSVSNVFLLLLFLNHWVKLNQTWLWTSLRRRNLNYTNIFFIRTIAQESAIFTSKRA